MAKRLAPVDRGGSIVARLCRCDSHRSGQQDGADCAQRNRFLPRFQREGAHYLLKITFWLDWQFLFDTCADLRPHRRLVGRSWWWFADVVALPAAPASHLATLQDASFHCCSARGQFHPDEKRSQDVPLQFTYWCRDWSRRNGSFCTLATLLKALVDSCRICGQRALIICLFVHC